MGRTSSIDKLPPEILEAFFEWVEDPAVGLDQVCEQVNEQLIEKGLEELVVSRSAVGRKAKSYTEQMQRMGEEMRIAKASTQLFYDQFGDGISEGGKFLAETMQAFILKLNITLHKFDDDEMSMGQVFEYSKIVKNLTGAISQLELALSRYTDREAEIKKQATEDAAETAEQAMKQSGLSAESVEQIKNEILGIRS